MVAEASVEATADFPADFRAATPGGLSAPFIRVPLDSARCLVPGAAPQQACGGSPVPPPQGLHWRLRWLLLLLLPGLERLRLGKFLQLHTDIVTDPDQMHRRVGAVKGLNA